MGEEHKNYPELEDLFPRQLKRIYKDMDTPTNQWEEVPVNLCDICLDVRSQYTGASDPWDYELLFKTKQMFQRRLHEWRLPSRGMDCFVKQMVIHAIDFIDLSIEERKEWKGFMPKSESD